MGYIDEMRNGYIGGFHWTDFAVEGWNTYLGIATEAYECSEEGMTIAWNNKEKQLCEGAGICEDLNDDGHVIANFPSTPNHHEDIKTPNAMESRLKDHFAGMNIWVRGYKKVKCHIMLAVSCLAADELFRQLC